MIYSSLYLDRTALHLNLAYTTDPGEHSDITLQNALNREYTLRLFVENEEIELQTQDYRSWSPVQRPYGPRFSIRCTN